MGLQALETKRAIRVALATGILFILSGCAAGVRDKIDLANALDGNDDLPYNK